MPENPDNITKNNGYFTGTILGDGYDKLDIFKNGIQKCILEYKEEEIRESIIKISDNHNIEKFKENMRKLIKYQCKN